MPVGIGGRNIWLLIKKLRKENKKASFGFLITHHRFSVTFFFSLAVAFFYSAENKPPFLKFCFS